MMLREYTKQVQHRKYQPEWDPNEGNEFDPNLCRRLARISKAVYTEGLFEPKDLVKAASGPLTS